MARKSKEVVITGDADNRDAGKVFFITEMSSRAAEEWAYRAFGAMVRAGVDIPPEVIATGMSGLAMVGIKAFMAAPWEDVEPLLDDLMACVTYQTDLREPSGDPIRRRLVDSGEDGDDIQELGTRVRLRDEVLSLHTSFSIIDTLYSGVSAVLTTLFPPDSSTTRTAGDQSEP